MARIINGQLYVASYDPTGNPGEYTFTDAEYNNQADEGGLGALAVQVGFLLYIPAADIYSFTPIPGVTHRYKITSIQSASYEKLSATIIWNEPGSEIDTPISSSYASISEETTNLEFGLPASVDVYSSLPGGIAESAYNYNLRDILDNLTTIITYTGTAERTVGGITEGMDFTNASMTQMWDQLIKQEKFPTLTAPSSTFVSSITGFREINEILSIDFDSSFNRGSISPQYTAASPYRSGLPNTYQYTGVGLVTQGKTDATDSQTVLGYVVSSGDQSWQGRVFYDAGVQPKSSYDNDYSTPLPLGNTNYITRTITGVYPTFATTVIISTMTKNPLAAHTSSYIQTDMVAESGGFKQTADFPTVWSTITGIQFYNTVSSQWEWINGSKANSLLTFTVTSTTHTVQGNVVIYNRFSNNGASIGARQLRWYTT
jgi:hypothetical protein